MGYNVIGVYRWIFPQFYNIPDTCVAIVFAGQDVLSVIKASPDTNISLKIVFRIDDSHNYEVAVVRQTLQRTSRTLHCTGNIMQYKIQSDIDV